VSKVWAPTLIVGGDRDPLREPGCWEDLQRRIPRSELKVFSPARHCPRTELADEFNRPAIAFLRRHTEPDRAVADDGSVGVGGPSREG
jgi:pimeloyl-ACP methyl ester carboxylesterase